MILLEKINSVLQSQAQKIAFQYLLVRILEQDPKEKGSRPIESTNEENRITNTKIKLFPFFISIANGSFIEMHRLFGPFLGLAEGPVSLQSLTYIYTNDLEFFSLENSYRLDIRQTNGVNSLKSLKDKIINYKIGEHLFKDIALKKETETKQIIDCIENSIKALLFQTGGKFFSYEESDLIVLGRQQRTWAVINSYLKHISGRKPTLEDLELPIDEILKDPKVFVSADDISPVLLMNA